MKILRKYLALSIIIILFGVSAVPGFSKINPEIRQSNENTKIKIADIYTEWDEFGICTEVNVTCYNQNVTWTAENFGTVKGNLMYVNWSWKILKTPMVLPRAALYLMHIYDIDREKWIPFVIPLFYLKFFSKYGTGSFTGNIGLSFNTKGRDYIPLKVFVSVRGFAKYTPSDNTTYFDSGISYVNVTII